MKRAFSRKPLPTRCCRCSCANRNPRPSSADFLTVLPGFFTKGAKGSTSVFSPSSAAAPGDENVKTTAPRRSWRLAKNNQPITVSGYFSKLMQDTGGDSPTIEEEFDEEFEKGLFENLNGFKLKENSYYKGKVREEIEVINSVLLGKSEKNMSMNRKRAYSEEDKENFPMKFPYVPPSNWVFQTPPNRKLNYNHVKTENSMKPAVIETRDEKKVVYEMNKKINVDLSKFGNSQEIDIDKRYMVEVAQGQDEEKMDFLQSDPFELEQHFLSLTCRPKKVLPTQPRYNIVKRKRDIFEPQPGCSTDDDFKPPNVCFLDNLNFTSLEESFTFKFTSSESEASSSGHLFNFDENQKNTFNFRF